MTKLTTAALAAAFLCMPLAVAASDLPLLARSGGILIEDGYARAAGAAARSGAAFMAITNETDSDDRLVAARGDAAQRIELHTHVMTDGVARMMEVEDGIPLPAGETVMLERGGLHVMFMGLNGPFKAGATVDVTLVFENAGEIEVAIPVDLERGPAE
jgi:copper(I)-binding protein